MLNRSKFRRLVKDYGRGAKLLMTGLLVFAFGFLPMFSSHQLNSLAHDGATGIVGERMRGMSTMGRALRGITEQMNGEQSTDEMALQAEILRQEAELILQKFAIEEMGQGTEASPDIWLKPLEFSLQSKAFLLSVEELIVTIDEAQIHDIPGALRAVQANCGQCHAQFRQK